jgi:hypothetical protein
VEINMEFLKKLKPEPPYDPSIALLGTYPMECKPTYNRDNCTSVFIVARFITAKGSHQPRCPSADELKKERQYICMWRSITPHKREQS